MNINQLTQAILKGDFDKDLGMISTAIKSRKAATKPTQTMSTIFDLDVGDTVRFNEFARPKYIQGTTARVVKVNRARVKIELDRAVGRFPGGQPVSCPPKIITKVN